MGAAQGQARLSRDERAPPPAAAVVTRVLEVLPHASTSPALVETADGAAWVMKFAGAGPGPFGLLTELLALGIARALGAPAPAAQPVFLPEGFPWQVGTDEFDSMLQRSNGWNLGIGWLPAARPAAAADLAAAPTALDAIARADALLVNVDRTGEEPEPLLVSSGRLWAIDYDACLYSLARSAGRARRRHAAARATSSPAGAPAAASPPLDVAGLVAAAPDDWVAAAGIDRATLAARLAASYAAWAAV